MKLSDQLDDLGELFIIYPHTRRLKIFSGLEKRLVPEFGRRMSIHADCSQCVF